MKESIKEWLALATTPAVMITHYHTQWQGLLNVYGALCVLVSLFMVFCIAIMIFVMTTEYDVPKFPFPKFSRPQRIIGITISVCTAVYLLWTGHLIVASFYILSTLLGYAALGAMWIVSQHE